MTAGEILLAGAIMGAVGRLASPLIATMFCTAGAPQWLRTLSDWTIALVFLRLIAVQVGDYPLDQVSALIYLAAGGVSLVVLGYHVRRVVGRGGDRCPG